MKIIKMKDLAVSYKLRTAKDFNTTEQYLEYVITEINKKGTKYKFHQFLLLIDVLYVILDTKKNEAGNIVVERFNSATEIENHYNVARGAAAEDFEAVKAFEENMHKEPESKDPTPKLNVSQTKVFKKQKLGWK